MTSVARRVASLAFFVALFLASDATPEIYRWTDDSGVEHFTQNLAEVPARHRPSARDAAKRPEPDRLQSFDGAPASRAAQRSRRARRLGDAHTVHFQPYGTLMMVEVVLNDQVRAPFLADTGASGISIPHSLAQQLGIRIDGSTPTVVVGTANGSVETPLVSLESVQLGSARVEGLRAHVSSSMEFGLLGGSFFNNFVYQVDAAQGVITMRENDAVRAGLTRAQWSERFARMRAPIRKLDERLEMGLERRKGRVAELERRRDVLGQALRELESEADRAEVPQVWRE